MRKFLVKILYKVLWKFDYTHKYGINFYIDLKYGNNKNSGLTIHDPIRTTEEFEDFLVKFNQFYKQLCFYNRYFEKHEFYFYIINREMVEKEIN